MRRSFSCHWLQVEKDEEYIKSIAALGGKVEELVKANNAIDIYQEYFSGRVSCSPSPKGHEGGVSCRWLGGALCTTGRFQAAPHHHAGTMKAASVKASNAINRVQCVAGEAAADN